MYLRKKELWNLDGLKEFWFVVVEMIIILAFQIIFFYFTIISYNKLLSNIEIYMYYLCFFFWYLYISPIVNVKQKEHII